MENKEKEIIEFDDCKSTIFDRIRWKLKDIRYYPSEFIIGVKNLIKWFPIVWKDRDWDYHYIFEVLKFKIKKQAKYIDKKNRFEDSKRKVEIMNVVTKLIQFEQDEMYSLEYMKYHKTKYFFVETDEEFENNKTYEWKSNQLSENFDEYFKKYPRQYKKAVSGELSRFTRHEDESKNKQIYAMEIAYENQERCRRLLFSILSNNILGWWD